MKWGDNAQKVAEAAEDAGLARPQSTIPPECDERLLGWLHVFDLLGSCRASSGYGEGQIPWTAIDRYAERNGYLSDDLLYHDLIHISAHMDREYLGFKISKAEAKRKGSAESQMQNQDW